MHFEKAYLKLTFFYVAIIMFLSVIFSIAIYNISAEELSTGLNRQTKVLNELPLKVDTMDSKIWPNFEQLRLNQIDESNNRLKINLFYYNLLILFFSSIISYFFAKKTLEPIEEAMSAQDRFTADASHELRTPLAAMRAEIEVNLRDKKLNVDDATKLLRSNLEEIEKLESLSNALLKMASYQQEGNLSFLEVSLAEVLVEAYGKVESLASKKSIEFENELQDISIKGDKPSLVELFVILLDNSIKYSPEKSRIAIKLKSQDGKIIVKIKDNGVGIKATDLPYIFNRFYRADTSRSKEKINGYGLGLSIAKRIVELHKGSILVKSIPNKGSEFIITFSKLK